jgi:cbb3-type cytochrome oxidase subunit 3
MNKKSIRECIAFCFVLVLTIITLALWWAVTGD